LSEPAGKIGCLSQIVRGTLLRVPCHVCERPFGRSLSGRHAHLAEFVDGLRQVRPSLLERAYRSMEKAHIEQGVSNQSTHAQDVSNPDGLAVVALGFFVVRAPGRPRCLDVALQPRAPATLAAATRAAGRGRPSSASASHPQTKGVKCHEFLENQISPTVRLKKTSFPPLLFEIVQLFHLCGEFRLSPVARMPDLEHRLS
jgi:hypothetical protein